MFNNHKFGGRDAEGGVRVEGALILALAPTDRVSGRIDSSASEIGFGHDVRVRGQRCPIRPVRARIRKGRIHQERMAIRAMEPAAKSNDPGAIISVIGPKANREFIERDPRGFRPRGGKKRDDIVILDIVGLLRAGHAAVVVVEGVIIGAEKIAIGVKLVAMRVVAHHQELSIRLRGISWGIQRIKLGLAHVIRGPARAAERANVKPIVKGLRAEEQRKGTYGRQ